MVDIEMIRSVAWLVILVVIVGYIAYVIFHMPRFQQCAGNPMVQEGFFGGVAVGSGHPDCLRTLEGSAALLEKVAGASARPDYVEFQLILSKLACLKKDLMSPSGIVEATRYQPFETAHDREPVAEVTAQCLSQTIPQRDLDIIFDTWKTRGGVLLRRLCTIANLKEAEAVEAEKLFGKLWADVYDIAKGRCIATTGMREAVGHEEQPFTPPALENTRAYDGYYSGWGGQI
jgi:hypothetical protein